MLTKIEGAILSTVIDETEDTFDGCGIACFQDVIENLGNESQFQELVQTKINEIINSDTVINEDEDVKEIAEYKVFENSFETLMTKLKKEIKEIK